MKSFSFGNALMVGKDANVIGPNMLQSPSLIGGTFTLKAFGLESQPIPFNAKADDMRKGCMDLGLLVYDIQISPTERTLARSWTITFEEYTACSQNFKDDSFYIFMKFIDKFKKNVLEVKKFCNHKKFIVFPLHIAFFDNYKKQIKFAGHHASLAILDQDKNMIYLVDSDNIENIEKDLAYDEKKYEKYVCNKVKYCIETVMQKYGLSNDFKIKFLDVRSPQSKTKDDYCIFWSLAITEEMFKNFGNQNSDDFNPSKTMKEFMKTYNTKKKLENYIQNFILSSF
jgi:hypothetical protein